MDKFGIFNLLNGLFSYYQQNKASDSASNQSSPSPSFEDTPPSFNKDSSHKPNTAPIKKPLQKGMLNVMSNHDAHFNRVMNQTRK